MGVPATWDSGNKFRTEQPHQANGSTTEWERTAQMNLVDFGKNPTFLIGFNHFPAKMAATYAVHDRDGFPESQLSLTPHRQSLAMARIIRILLKQCGKMGVSSGR